MSKRISAEVMTHEEAQTGVHLLMAGVASVFCVILSIVTLIMSWELWTIPLAVIGSLFIWVVHIWGNVSEAVYEYLCTGYLLVGFFYYGVHIGSLDDISVMACFLFLVLSFLRKRKLLYLAMLTYVLVLSYQCVVLRTMGFGMGTAGSVHLALGVTGTAGVMLLSRYMIARWGEEEKEHHQMMAQLKEARRQNADFLSSVSHELRTPVNMVTGISEVAMGREMPSGLREGMQSIHMAGRRLSGQIDNILDYTEIVENTLVVTKENYMISSVINDVITTAGIHAGGKGLEIVFDVDVKIPSVLVGDEEKIGRVLKILLDNAVKYTEKGGINVRIGFRRESYGGNLLIDICDTGVGMTSSQLLRLYDDLRQPDAGRGGYTGGMGLGIPIVRGILHAMDGFIHFESKDKQGHQVHITIPQGVADETPGMEVLNPKEFCIVCYFKPEKYSRKEIREYYDNMILHMVEGLGIEGYRAYHFDDLAKLQRVHKPTHLFIAQEEYEEYGSYYEELGRSICVVIVAGRGFSLPRDSSLVLFRKPFFALSVVNLLNGEAHGSDFEDSFAARCAFSCAGVRALVVDDEEMNLVVARGILESYGMRVDTCPGGKAALEQCMASTYDLIFLDHMMPGLDGVETLKRLREIKDGSYQSLPIIALTANTTSGAREMFKREGFTEFIPKPIERSVLERVLRRVLPEQLIQYHAAAPSSIGTELIQTEKAGEGAGREHAVESANRESTGAGAGPEYVVESANRESAVEDAGPERDASPGEGTLFLAGLERCGVNTGLGLKYCSGDEAFYLEMLQMFCSLGARKREEIAFLYEAGDWADYAVKVHALKSTSLTVGAESLSGRAKALEQAAKNGDAAYVHKNHLAVLRDYETLCKGIAGIVGAEEDELGGDGS